MNATEQAAIQQGTRRGEPAAGPQSAQASIADLIRYAYTLLRRNFLVIAAIIGTVIVIGIVVTALQVPRFTAVTSIQINDQSDKVLGDQMDASMDSSNSWDVDRFLNTQIDILRSRGLALRVAQKRNLAEDKAFFVGMGVDAPAPDESKESVRDNVVGLLSANLAVELGEISRIASISFNSPDPELAAKIANDFAEEFIQSNLQRRYDSSAYARDFVSGQLQTARTRLEQSERELNAYAREAGLIRARSTAGNDNVDSSASVTGASLMQLNEAANTAEAKRVEAEGRWNAERATPLLSSKTVLANETVQDLMTKHSTKVSELKDARQRYLADHPSVARLTSEVAALETQLNIVAEQVRASIRAEYVGAQAAESALHGRVDELKGATLAEQDRLVRYNTLSREADTNRQIYDGLLQRYRELNASAGISTSNVAIIDKADPPLSPSSPNLLRNLLLSFVAGCAMAAAYVFLRDQLDDRIRIPEDVEEKIQLHLLGVIPLSGNVEPLVAMEDPKSPLSEAYNSLRGSLFHSTAEGLPRILLITSAQPSEGKTTTSYAIARSMALAGKRTLLIDADLRRPSVHRISGSDNKRGLSSLLTSLDPLESGYADTSEGGLWLITSGPIPPSPTELLSSGRMISLMEEAASKFDIVIIDSAPVLGLADSPVLSAIADGVLLVVEADRGRGGALKTAIRRLRAMNPLLLGAVLTKFNAAHGGNRYSEYYGYEYYRYSKDEKETA